MSTPDLAAAAVLLAVYASIAFIFWRYPDFRRAFVAYWRPESIAARTTAWAERVNERSREL